MNVFKVNFEVVFEDIVARIQLTPEAAHVHVILVDGYTVFDIAARE